MSKVLIYWIFVLLTFLYILRKNYKSPLRILIILCFYSGLASFLGKAIENPYKILLVLLSLYILNKNNGFSHLNSKYRFLLFVFIIFSFSFLYSSFINGDYFNLAFSQYGKIFTPVCILLVFNKVIQKKPEAADSLKTFLFSLLNIQILLTVAKIFTIGLQESTVGSIAYIGGGPATIIPILGFILVWLNKRGNLKREDWIYTILLLLIGIVSFKRAILFIMPVIILLFMYYVQKRLKIKHMLYVVPLLPLIFYAGVRLNPTLNKEKKIGGSFDLNYVLEYTQNYSFGKTSESPEIQLGQGRGGATFLIWTKLFDNQTLTFNDFWGIGLKEVYTTDYEEFENKGYGVNSKGSASGIFQSYLTTGYVGVVITILFLISILSLIKEQRIKVTLGLLLFWDFLFYSGLIIRTQGLFILLFFIIIYSNKIFEEKASTLEAKLITANEAQTALRIS